MGVAGRGDRGAKMEEEKGGNEERMGSQRNRKQHDKRDGQGKRMEGGKVGTETKRPRQR